MLEFNDEIISIEEIEEMELMDIEVDSEDHLFYASDILTHNSGVDVTEYDHSHIAGGISKINTADNVFAIHSPNGMKEKGISKLQFLKTRSAASTGQFIELAYDPKSMRVTDKIIQEDVDKPFNKTDLRETLANVTTNTTNLKSKENIGVISRMRDKINSDAL